MKHHQKRPSKEFYLRKTIHIIGGIIVIFLGNYSIYSWGLPATLKLAGLLLLITMIGEFVRVDWNLMPWTDRIAKEKEKHHFSAVTYFFAVSIILLALFETNVAFAAISIAIVGDGFAACIGMKWGRKSVPWNTHKSWKGMYAYIIAAVIASSFFVPLSVGIPLAIIAGLTESMCEHIDDNFLIPLLVGFLGFGLSLL
jgi:dolichol kinase